MKSFILIAICLGFVGAAESACLQTSWDAFKSGIEECVENNTNLSDMRQNIMNVTEEIWNSIQDFNLAKTNCDGNGSCLFREALMLIGGTFANVLPLYEKLVRFQLDINAEECFYMALTKQVDVIKDCTKNN